MVKKKLSESVATRSTMVLRPPTRKPTTGVKNLKADERNTETAENRVKRVKAVNKNEMDKGAATGSTRVLRSDSAKKGRFKPTRVPRSNSGKKEDESVKEVVKESAKPKTKKPKKILPTKKEAPLVIGSRPKPKKNLLAKKKAPLTIRIPKPKKNIPVKKEASPTIARPKPKKNLAAEASKRTTRNCGEDTLSKEQAKDTTANSCITVQGLKNHETSTNEKDKLVKGKKTDVVVTDLVLPPEIIMEILSWLQVEFFGSPMVVCKQWYALIQDRYFIEKHMNRDLRYIPPNSRYHIQDNYEYVTACDGLKLEKNISTHKYHIRNPATKQVLELPDPHEGSHGIVLSYVPHTGNYKAVSLYDDENNIKCCEVLSVGNAEFAWRPLKRPTREDLERNCKEVSVVSTNDAIHFVPIIASGDNMVEEVVSLDLGTEQFTVTNLPRGQYKNWEEVWPLYFKGKLALIHKIGAELYVLVLENYKKQKWGKKESFFPLELMKKLEEKTGTIYPCCFDQSEILWFWVEDNKKFISYDIKNNEIITEEMHCIGHSLVRLTGMQPEEKTPT